MSDNLFISEILFAIISTIALLVTWQLVRSKDGMLRKILIAYFIVEFFVYAASGLYFFLKEKNIISVSIDVFRLVAITPKAMCMLLLFFYLRSRKSN